MKYENVEAWAEDKLKDLLDDLEETLILASSYEGGVHLAHLEQDAQDNLLNGACKYMAVINACKLLRRWD